MKLNKFILGAASLAMAGGMAFAQNVTFHAGVDYTVWGASQAFYNDDGTTSNTENSAGYDPDGNMTVDVSVKAASFEFNLGLYFNADGGDEEYIDFSDGGKGTPFYQGNMKAGFFNDQVNVYTGKFEDFNGGYIADGAVFGEQYITNLADSDYGPYLTGLEFVPAFVSGLKVFAGFPILPIRGNGIQANEEYNQWKYLGKKVKIATSYQVPVSGLDLTLNAGFRPGTYYDGVDNGGTMSTFTETFTKSAFGEGYLQAVVPNLFDMLNLTVSYDIRYRDGEYTNIYNETEEHKAFAHMIGVSGEMSPLEGLTLSAEDRFFFAGDDYLQSDEKLIYNAFGFNAEYALAGTQVAVGLGLAEIIAGDANGTAFADSDGTGKINNSSYASNSDIALTLNDMATANLPGGAATKYTGTYVKPYFKYNFSNGALIAAFELAYTKAWTEDVSNTCLSYRVPVGIKFEF
ncbi:MAG: hypothetical protein II821_02820 [Treponema sp.]|nr:hypothetical protein [Treponema sp.]